MLCANMGANGEAEFLTHEEDVLKRSVKGDATEAGLIRVNLIFNY